MLSVERLEKAKKICIWINAVGIGEMKGVYKRPYNQAPKMSIGGKVNQHRSKISN